MDADDAKQASATSPPKVETPPVKPTGPIPVDATQVAEAPANLPASPADEPPNTRQQGP